MITFRWIGWAVAAKLEEYHNKRQGFKLNYKFNRPGFNIGGASDVSD